MSSIFPLSYIFTNTVKHFIGFSVPESPGYTCKYFLGADLLLAVATEIKTGIETEAEAAYIFVI